MDSGRDETGFVDLDDVLGLVTDQPWAVRQSPQAAKTRT
jgi:hypothetical protein